MFYLTMHSTHFIYSYMASDIWLRTILIVREETRCRHIDYSFRVTARVLLYASSHRQDSTSFVTPVVEHWVEREIAQWVHPMKDRSDDPSHHERMLLPLSYISLPNSIKEVAGWMEWKNVLRNNRLFTFYVQLYWFGYMNKDYSENETENPLPTQHGLFFSTKGSFTCTLPQTE